eukprot:365061-Chlamydomonas_euryale.AAC.9
MIATGMERDAAAGASGVDLCFELRLSDSGNGGDAGAWKLIAAEYDDLRKFLDGQAAGVQVRRCGCATSWGDGRCARARCCTAHGMGMAAGQGCCLAWPRPATAAQAAADTAAARHAARRCAARPQAYCAISIVTSSTAFLCSSGGGGGSGNKGCGRGGAPSRGIRCDDAVVHCLRRLFLRSPTAQVGDGDDEAGAAALVFLARAMVAGVDEQRAARRAWPLSKIVSHCNTK